MRGREAGDAFKGRMCVRAVLGRSARLGKLRRLCAALERGGGGLAACR